MEGVYFVEQGGGEWDCMWAWLGDHPINEGLEHPTVAESGQFGECWQYMGTERMSDGDWSHCFRHRYHPQRVEKGLEPRVYLRSWKAPAPEGGA